MVFSRPVWHNLEPVASRQDVWIDTETFFISTYVDQLQPRNYQQLDPQQCFLIEKHFLDSIEENTLVRDLEKVILWPRVAWKYFSSIKKCQIAYRNIFRRSVQERISKSQCGLSKEFAWRYFSYVTDYHRTVEEASVHLKRSVGWCSIVHEVLFGIEPTG